MRNKFVTSAESLITNHAETRAGFLNIALEKNRAGDPFVKNAFAFKAMVAHTKTPDDLLTVKEIRPFLVTAAGLSDKSLAYLNEADRMLAVEELIEKFLKPAGASYIDEVIFRYLLIKGDTVGGIMRNRIGKLGQERLIRMIFSVMNVRGITCDKLAVNSDAWESADTFAADAEKNLRALHWSTLHGERVLIFNAKIPTVNKNVDLCLFDGGLEDCSQIVRRNDKAVMFGELKCGIDPAGADEHWKTGNSALNRIRTKFAEVGFAQIKTSFIAAAIERAMAEEIFAQLQSGTLSNAVNLTKDNQLAEFCNWLIDLRRAAQ